MVHAPRENEKWMPPLRTAFKDLNLPFEEWHLARPDPAGRLASEQYPVGIHTRSFIQPRNHCDDVAHRREGGIVMSHSPCYVYRRSSGWPQPRRANSMARSKY